MINRRDLLKVAAAAGAATFLPLTGYAANNTPKARFRYCLNTSTIKGQGHGLLENIDVAARAGYDGVELWIRDIKSYLEQGHSTQSLRKYIVDSGVKVENAIGFAPCFVKDEKKRKQGFVQMKEEMELMAALDCKRIAAPPADVQKDSCPDFYTMGQYYHELLNLGRRTGVMPHLEFWGASPTLYQFGQALMVAASANDPDARLLPDVYHMFRGNSGFEGLKMVSGNFIELFHMNDYPGNIEREKQTDADRVYPGDGVAPMEQILTDLYNMGGSKVLSLELFNPGYWKQDALEVAKTGLQKMKTLTERVI